VQRWRKRAVKEPRRHIGPGFSSWTQCYEIPASSDNLCFKGRVVLGKDLTGI
jgi:hypothetical protein